MKNIIILLSMFLINTSSCKSKNADSIPEGIQKIIVQIKSKEVANPPIHVYSYNYTEKTVYYVTSKCCDIPSSLYDEYAKKICSPDGGFTGKGDGKCSDFFDKKTDEKLIWKDERKQVTKKLKN